MTKFERLFIFTINYLEFYQHKQTKPYHDIKQDNALVTLC